MLHEQQKVVKIIGELTMYFLRLGADQISSGITRKGDHVTITFRADYDPDNADRLQDLEKYLNMQKSDGFEDIYWGLAGSDDSGDTDELLLVGMMIDRAQIAIEDGAVSLTLYKNLGAGSD